MKRFIILLCATAILCSCDNKALTDYNTNPEDNFEYLWELMNTRYCYFESRGIDWVDVYADYKKRALRVKTSFELFYVLADMLDTLKDGHVNLYSPFDISRSRGWYEDYPANYYESVIYSSRYLGPDYRVAGGFNYGRIANDSIGYIRYSSFSSGFSAANLYYMNIYFSKCKGIILDVRNNGGGQLDYSERLASCFFNERTLTGYIRHKKGPGHNDFSAPTPTYVNPSNQPIDWSEKNVVVLCNRRSYSATNDFIVKMLYAPNAVVMGGITGGGGGMPLSSELPIGWMVRFSAVPQYNAEMQEIEFGVEPQIEVTTTEEDALQGKDMIIERAVELLMGS